MYEKFNIFEQLHVFDNMATEYGLINSSEFLIKTAIICGHTMDIESLKFMINKIK